MDHFELVSQYKPTTGDSRACRRGKKGNQFETLFGVTGSKNRWYFVVCGWTSRCCGSGESIGEKRVDEEAL